MLHFVALFCCFVKTIIHKRTQETFLLCQSNRGFRQSCSFADYLQISFIRIPNFSLSLNINKFF